MISKVTKLQRINNLIKVIYDDGTHQLCYPSGATIWFPASSGTTTPPPPTGDGYKWPFPRDTYTTYDGHSGLDFPGGTVGNSAPIKAIGPGVVSAVYDTNYNTTDMGTAGRAEPVWRGICVVVDHGVIDGVQTYSLYAHLSSRSVNVGDTVNGGTKVGVIGDTGYSFGTHLHFEVNVPNRRPTDSVPSGGDVTLGWMDAHTDGSNW